MPILSFATDATQLSNNVGTVNGDTVYLAPYMLRSIEVGTSSRAGLPSFAPQSDIWFSGQYRTQATLNASAQLLLFTGNGVDVARVLAGSSALVFQAWDGGAWVGLSAPNSFTIISSAVNRFDVRVNVSNTGNFDLYANGALQASFTGDTLLGAQTTIDTVWLGNVRATGSSHWSGCFVADEDTRLIVAQHLRPIGNGFHTAWTGDYTDVDDLGDIDGNIINTVTADDLETYTKTTMTTDFDTGYEFMSLGVSAKARRAATGPQNLQLVCRSDTTDGVSASIPLDVTYDTKQGFFANDPATAAAWLKAAMDSAQVGVKAIT